MNAVFYNLAWGGLPAVDTLAFTVVEPLAWWNLIFLLPAVIAMVYLGLFILTGGTDTGVAPDAPVDFAADSNTDFESMPGALPAAVLSFFGFGRAPTALLLFSLLLSFGLSGFIANQIARENTTAGLTGAGVLAVSLPIAAIIALTLTRGVAFMLTRVFPLNESAARRRVDMLGLRGQAVFDISGESGAAAVRDATGTLQQVACRVGPDEPPIAKGASVRLVGWNAPGSFYFVEPAN